MSLLDKLPSKMSRDSLTADARSFLTRLDNTALPMYESLAVSSTSWGSDFFKERNAQYRKNVGTIKTNFIVDTLARLRIISQRLAGVESTLTDSLPETIMIDGISFRHVYLVKVLEYIGFAIDFAVDLGNFAMIHELARFEESPSTYVDAQIPKPVQKQIDKRFDVFCQIMKNFAVDEAKFSSALRNVPDINVSATNQSMAVQTLHDHDQLHLMNFTGSTWTINPIYHLRNLVLSYQDYRQRAAVAAYQQAQLGLIELKNLQNESPNPQLQAKIENAQERINQLRFKLAEMQE